MEKLDALSETLDTELKGWLVPSVPREAALLAKACLALRNNNGGRVVLGIDDSTTNSIARPSGFDVREVYHADKLNEAIGRYAVPKFDVRLELVEYQGAVHPIVIVPGGIETPVITRSGFERELRQNAIYVR